MPTCSARVSVDGSLRITFNRARSCMSRDHGKDSAREIREYYIPDFIGGGTTTKKVILGSRILPLRG